MSHYSYYRDAAGRITIKPKQEWYTPKQTAAVLNVSSVTAWRFIDKEKIQAQRIGGRWRVHYDALVAYIILSLKGGV